MKSYCKSCGSPTTWTNSPPKCCSECGKSFLSESTATKLKIKPKIQIELDEDEEDDEKSENEENEIPEIKKIQIESIGNLRNTVKVGQIAVDRGPKEKLNRAQEKKQSFKKFTEEWKSEFTPRKREETED